MATRKSPRVPARRPAPLRFGPQAWLALGLVGIAAAAYLLLSGPERSFEDPPRSDLRAQALPATSRVDPAPERLRIHVIASFPHDPDLYTQGLLWEPGGFVESAGRYGRSLLRRWRPGMSRPLTEIRLPDSIFAEGIAAVGDTIIQLSWREGVAFYRDHDSLEERARVAYRGEGWGLCFDGQRLIMSDGSDRLTRRDPETFAALGTVAVRAGTRPLGDLNELECAEGWVYANVYGSDQIARIDPETGRVAALIDASGLLTADERAAGAEVLNGIAYNPGTQTFYLTGKLWPRLFEVDFTPVTVRPH